jgi:integrase
MATIRKRGLTYYVEVRRKGRPPQRNSFKTNTAAKAWGRRIETAMDNGSWFDPTVASNADLPEVIDRYVDSYTRLGQKVDPPKLATLLQLKIYFQGMSLHDLTEEDVVAYSVMRRETIKASTLLKQLHYLKAAIRESGIRTETNAVGDALKSLTKKRMVGASISRERRVEKDIPAKDGRPERVGEYRRLKAAVLPDGPRRKQWIMHAIDIAIITGMRMGEIFTLEFSDGRPLTAEAVPFGRGYIDLDQNLIGLWRKNKKFEGGKKFTIIPLWKDVREVLLRGQDYFGTTGALFTFVDADRIGDTFARLCKKAGIIGLRFHDLRHEATSRMFEPKHLGGRGMTAEQVIVVTSHGSMDQLQTYTNLRAEDLRDM